MPRLLLALPLLAALILGAPPARAQAPGAGGPPPAVGVARVEPRAITETQDFVGRVQAPQRVALVARVTAFLDRQAFTEGAEVKAGDLLYVLEQAPFQADLAAKQASVAEAAARLEDPHLWERAQRLGLDLDRFERDRRSDQVTLRVKRDFLTGVRAGVITTPTIFVAGQTLGGRIDEPVLRGLLA